MAQRLFFYDDADLTARQGLHLSPGSVEKLGPMQWEHRACDLGRASVFAGAVIAMPGGGYRLYYSTNQYDGERLYRVCFAESADGVSWEKPNLGQAQYQGEDTNWIWPEGMPAGSRITQPQVTLTPEGRWLMWFWWHGHDVGRMPYVLAESADGICWRVVDLDMPHIMHPADRELGQNSWVAGLTQASPEDKFAHERTMDWTEAKRLRSNDATYVYYNPQTRQYEMYSVWLMPNDETTFRRTPHDNAPQVIRTIHRRESPDGIHWSDPEMIVTPDHHDPLHQQFYYLAVQRDHGWCLGFLGHYRCWEQTMDIELCFSRDSHKWQRPLRGGWIPRGGIDEVDYFSAYATSGLIDRGDHWLLLYRGGNSKHNRKLPEGVSEARLDNLVAAVPKGRFAGLRTTERMIGSLTLKPFNHGAPQLAVDACVRGRLQAELRDPYGRPLPGYELNACRVVTGDSQDHVLVWGDGKTSADFRYDTVSLRVEVEDGILYSIDT